MRSRIHLLVLPLAALLAIFPMMFTGPSCGHDFDFHLLSWLEAAGQMAHGGYPHWAFTPAYNAGEPRFLFYPPLSWMLGGLLGMVLPWKFVAIAFTWISLTLSGFTARRLALGFAGAGAALVAAVVYLLNPYMLFAAYERTAYGELLAAAWLPILLAAALAPRVRMLPVAGAIALLWLTNAPAAVMGCYALALLTVVRLVLARRDATAAKALAWKTAAGTALGLVLASFYVLPAAYERRFVQASSAMDGGMAIRENTLFHHMSPATADTVFHDLILHQASVLALGALAAIAIAVALSLRKRAPDTSATARVTDREITVPLLVLVGAIVFLLTPLSLAVWAHVPELAYLQFPWRFTAVLMPVLTVFLARALPYLDGRGAVLLSALAALLLVGFGWRGYHQVCYPEDTVPAWVALFHSTEGIEPTDEYTPVSGDSDTLKDNNPPYWSECADKVKDGEDAGFQPHAGDAQGGLPAHFSVTLPCPSLVVLNRRQYPAWHVLLNGRATAPYAPERDDGLMTVPMPAGTDRVEMVFAETWDRVAGLLLSLLALAITAWLWMVERRRRIH